MTVAAQIGRARTLLEKGDFLPILALVIAVQGTVLISQSGAALFLDPVAIGKIRLFESVISIGVLVAGFGAPALAIREMASRDNANRRGEVLRDLLILPILGAAVLCIAAIVATLFGAGWILPLRDVLLASSVLLIAVNLVRMASAVAQGLVIVQQVYLWVIAGSIMAALLQISGAAFGTLPTWITGRLLGELVLLGCMLMAMRAHFPAIRWRRSVDFPALLRMMTQATIINLGLIVRMVADAAPILLLGGVLVQVTRATTGIAIGHFGVATLFLTAALLPLSVMSQRALPLITAAPSKMAIVSAFRRKILVVGFVIAAVLSAVALSLRLLDDGRMDAGLVAAALLMIAVPMKAFASAIGTAMLAQGELKLPVWITSAELVTIILVFACSNAIDAIWTAVFSVIAGSAISMASMIVANRIMNKRIYAN